MLLSSGGADSASTIGNGGFETLSNGATAFNDVINGGTMFVSSGAAVSAIAFLYVRGGFDLVLGTTAVVALGFVIGAFMIAALAHGIERNRVPAPAE